MRRRIILDDGVILKFFKIGDVLRITNVGLAVVKLQIVSTNEPRQLMFTDTNKFAITMPKIVSQRGSKFSHRTL